MKFSVIIPIYNVEKYLAKCIESVIEQEFDTKNYEILLIDDGSTDGSSIICDEYAGLFDNIIVVHKENGGLSDARNAGILVSKAQYLMFLDSDDTLTKNTLKICDELLSSQDFLIGNQNRISEMGSEKKDFPVLVFEKKNSIRNALEIFVDEYGVIPWAAYQNVYSAAIIKENEIFFKKGLVGAEDCEFFFNYIKYIKNFQVTNHSLVNYLMIRPDSIMNKVKFDSVIGRLTTFSKLFNESRSSTIQKFFSFKFCNTILDLPKLTSDYEQTKCVDYINNNKNVLKFAKERDRKYLIANIIWSSFGFVRGSNLLNFVLKKSGVKS